MSLEAYLAELERKDAERRAYVAQRLVKVGFDRLLEDAMWAGDMDLLDDIAPCGCCCHEHTHGRGCPAYAWGGCRGQGSAEWPEEEMAWCRFYQAHHGMTEAEFFCLDE